MWSSEVLHIQKRDGGGYDLSHVARGHNRFWRSFNTGVEVLAILNVGPKTFYPVLRGWRQKVLDPLFYHSVAPSPQCP